MKTISIHNYSIGQQEFITVDDSIVDDCDTLEDYLTKRYNNLSNIEYMVIADMTNEIDDYLLIRNDEVIAVSGNSDFDGIEQSGDSIAKVKEVI